MPTRRGRKFALLLGALAIGGAIAASPHLLVGYHRFRLAKDFEYFFEIAENGPESLEGAAIEAFLQQPENRRAFFERFLDEVNEHLRTQDTEPVITWSRRLYSPARPVSLSDALANPLLQHGTLVVSWDPDAKKYFVSSSTVNVSGTSSASGAQHVEGPLAALAKWLSVFKGVEQISLGKDSPLRLSVGEPEREPRLDQLPQNFKLRSSPMVFPAVSVFEDPVAITIEPDPVAQRQHLFAMLSSNPRDRATATRALHQLKNRDADVALALIDAVGTTLDEAAVDVLARWTSEQLHAPLDAATKDLGQVSERPTRNQLGIIEVLARRLTSGDQDWALRHLTRLLALPDDEVAAMAAHGLARNQQRTEAVEGAVKALLSGLTRPVKARRAFLRTLPVLLNSDDTLAIEPLIGVLANDDVAVCRERAALSLSSLNEAALPALDALIAALSDPNGRVRFRAAQAIGAIGSRAARAVDALGKLEDDEFGLAREHARWTKDKLLGAPTVEPEPVRTAPPPRLNPLRDKVIR